MTNKIRIPYLIARGTTDTYNEIVFDYMGSAEFEFGETKESLCRVLLSQFVYKEITVTAKNGKPVKVNVAFKPDFDCDEYASYFQQLAQDQLRCKHYTNFNDNVNKTAKVIKLQYEMSYPIHMPNVWLDIRNDVFFHIGDKEEFDKIIDNARLNLK